MVFCFSYTLLSYIEHMTTPYHVFGIFILKNIKLQQNCNIGNIPIDVSVKIRLCTFVPRILY